MSRSPALPSTPGKIRVLLLTDEMEVGGTQRQIINIACSMDRTRFEPTVGFFRNRSFLVDELVGAGVPVVEIGKSARFDPGFVRRLAAMVREGRFDIMHCFSFSGEFWGTVTRRLLPAAQRPSLITSIRGQYEWYSPLHWGLKRWMARQSCHVIANSNAGGEFARRHMRLEPGAIDIVYNGVAQVSQAATPTAPTSESGGGVNALFVGRLVDEKNLPVLLRAMNRVRGSGHRLRLRLAGDGPLREQCARMAADLQLGDSVEFLGQCTNIAELIAASDFIVLPSLREGLSNVILEAMAVGRPVIASAVGGNVELLESMQTGLLFANDNDEELAAAMVTLIEDAGLRKRMGVLGRQRAVERFSIDSMVHAMQGFYYRSVSHAFWQRTHEGGR